MGLSYELSETVEMLVPKLDHCTLSRLHTFAVLFYRLDDQQSAYSISSTRGDCCFRQALRTVPEDTSIEEIGLRTHTVVRPVDA
jgi:hypothetical protein